MFFYYNNDTDIILLSLYSIFNEKLPKETIFYVHNLNFDGLLIIESLSKNKEFKFEVFIRNLQIYNITINYNNRFVYFRCSYKILPSSLKKISESFKLDAKLPFPYKFSSYENLNYIGEIPEFYFFNSLND